MWRENFPLRRRPSPCEAEGATNLVAEYAERTGRTVPAVGPVVWDFALNLCFQNFDEFFLLSFCVVRSVCSGFVQPTDSARLPSVWFPPREGARVAGVGAERPVTFCRVFFLDRIFCLDAMNVRRVRKLKICKFSLVSKICFLVSLLCSFCLLRWPDRWLGGESHGSSCG